MKTKNTVSVLVIMTVSMALLFFPVSTIGQNNKNKAKKTETEKKTESPVEKTGDEKEPDAETKIAPDARLHFAHPWLSQKLHTLPLAHLKSK